METHPLTPSRDPPPDLPPLRGEEIGKDQRSLFLPPPCNGVGDRGGGILTVDVSWNIHSSMESLWIALLGAIQGATEFLPVSSSGHLAAGQLMLARSKGGQILSDKPLLLEVLLHLATLAAVVVIYRREVIGTVRGAGRGLSALMHLKLREIADVDDDVNLAVAIIVGTIPTAAIGLAMRDPAGAVSRSPLALGISFTGCACILLAPDGGPAEKGAFRGVSL